MRLNPITQYTAVLVLFGMLAACEVTYHPDGWDAPRVHGRATQLQAERCDLCHGADLRGGVSEVACDTCHKPTWREDCTYCHGGELDDTGIPPRALDPTRELLGDVVVQVHLDHPAEGTIAHTACVACHTVPEDLTDPGHMFDATPGLAEVEFTASLGPRGHYSSGTCSTLYCHGTGREPATITAAASPSSQQQPCAACHAWQDSPPEVMATMSFMHVRHMGSTMRGGEMSCADCHATITNREGDVLKPADHVNGLAEVALREGIAMRITPQGCEGICHDVQHDTQRWGQGLAGAYHPPTWSTDDTVHGRAAKMGEEPCQDCHGVELRGGQTGVSCDTCHASDWRTDCTWCHSEVGSAGLPSRFEEHDRHVPKTSSHVAYDCALCHTSARNVLDQGHMFDDTPGRAEVQFRGLADGAQWNEGSCSELYCHSNGRGRGTVRSGTPLDCDGCHPRRGLSGEHSEHLGEGVSCEDCHGMVVASKVDILRPELHVNGRKEVDMPPGLEQIDGRCSGRCHGERHTNETW